jgi:hypothetical protein
MIAQTNMALQGNVETFFLASIMQMLHNNRKTGVLQVKRGSDEVNIGIENGTIVYAMSTNNDARLGIFLKAKGVINLEQLETCLAEGTQKKQTLGKVLVDKGYIASEQLEEFIRKQVEKIVYDLLFWDSGEFVYKDAILDLSGLVVTQLNITNIILEASRHIDEMAVFKKQILHNQLVFKLSTKTQEGEELKLTASEWKILGSVDGQLTVDELVRESGLDSFIVYKILHSLISCSIIEKQEQLPQPQDREGEDEGKDTIEEVDYTPIITPIISGYQNIMQILWRNLEPEIGKETSVMFEDCKPEALPGQKGLFKNFHPNNLLPANIFAVKQNLKILKTFKNEQVFLVESFNRYVLNILSRVPDLLGVLPTRKMLEEIRTVLPQITKYIEELSIESKSNISEDLKIIMEKVDQQISRKDKRKDKSTGILSIFKKGMESSPSRHRS